MVEKIDSSLDLKIYDDNENLKIYAGPGAGKTYLVVKNIKYIVEKSVKLKNNMRKVLCVTYTNAAVDEITERLGQYNDYVEVSTIHSFINKYIISQNQIQLKSIIKKDFDIEISKNSKLTSISEGRHIMSYLKRSEIVDFIDSNDYLVDTDRIKKFSINKLKEVQLDISSINDINSTKSDVEIYHHSDIMSSEAKIIKNSIWNIGNRLSFDEILYFGLRILEEYPLALYLIRSEFPYILLDEYQDTNPIQNIIVRLISEKESIITVIGDIAQSIYSFQGANYREFKEFSLPKSPYDLVEYVIDGNRRSNQNIIHLLNYMRKKDFNLNKQECIKNKDNLEKVKFIIQDENQNTRFKIHEVIDIETRFLTRKWSEAFKYLNHLDDNQIKIINKLHGAYTYMLNKDLNTEIEIRNDKWIKTVIELITLEEAYLKKNISRVFDVLEEKVEMEILLKEFSKDSNKKLKNIFEFLKIIFDSLDDSILLKDLVVKVNDALNDIGLDIKEKFLYPNEGDEDYFEPVYKIVDKLDYITAKKIINDIFSDSSRYMTIHKSKGKEFDSVLVNLVPFRREARIGISPKEIITNPSIFLEASDGNNVIAEFARIAYVGFSRAINNLYIHLYASNDESKEIKREIDSALSVYCNKNNIEKFYEFIMI